MPFAPTRDAQLKWIETKTAPRYWFAMATRVPNGMKTSLSRVMITRKPSARRMRFKRWATSRHLSFSLMRWPGTPPRSNPPWPASMTTVRVWPKADAAKARIPAKAEMKRERDRFIKKKAGVILIVRGIGLRTIGQFRRGSALRLGDGNIKHSAIHGDTAIGRTPQTRASLGFEKSRARQKFPIQSHMGISPTSRRGAMKNMQLVGAVDLCLRLFVRDDPA